MEERTARTAIPDNQLFYDAFKACPLGIAIENLEGQPLFVNSALCAMLGLGEVEMLGKHCVEFSPPEDAAKDWALFSQLRAGSIDHYQIDKRFFRRDGSTVWGRLSISLLKNPSPSMVVAVVEDITERKRAEEALQHREVELTEAQRLAGLGSWQWDARIDKVIWSKELYRITGRDPRLPAPSFKEHPSLFTAKSWERL